MAQSISELIRSRRKQLKITQPHLADLADVNVNTIGLNVTRLILH